MLDCRLGTGFLFSLKSKNEALAEDESEELGRSAGAVGNLRELQL